ncbi:phosphomannose isomerase (PMI) [Leptomonas seymouri]|uniref:mannose-6-phosphate isomerase n=1 Tax=Leptomonas seymouri TaxID=5684 RepID=A0A0N1I488_LEPSE|nr:phosphomannose isomerase (PMI) [Leptomonas seymouri]|eukprot:KPI90803.1 phosphomannose isomerase (PMI) [Leptomonas seymouri]
MFELVKIDAGCQDYAWGKDAKSSFVAKMKNLSEDTSGKHYAELWVGTHPSCPSKVGGANGGLLEDFLKKPENVKRFFSPAQQATGFRNTVPYLLKILSIRTALSIQAHPCKKLAEQLHLNLPDKYKDPNHKPELICALTPFEALCCFRSLKGIIAFLKKIPELAKLVGAEQVLGKYWTASTNELPAADSDEERQALKAMMEKLYHAPAEMCTKDLRTHLKRIKDGGERCPEDEVFARTYAQYPDDVGCWMVYFLNYVQLVPGQALFLSDSEPHAYISGDGVEIMACSDNVVRAGLTPKWKDVSTLINMLKYDTTGLASARHEKSVKEDAAKWQVQYYQPPKQFPDFSLFRLQYNHSSGNGTTTITLPTIGLGFCVEGTAKVNGVQVKMGDCFAVPYGKMTCQAEGSRSLVFVASTNDLSHCKSAL